MTDYSKTVIYKIQHCDDANLLYIGSTVAYNTRKSTHKNATNDEKSKKYNFKLYQMIRANGGWNAFNMVIIKAFPCDNKQESHTEEDRIIRLMKTTMNTNKAYNSPEEKVENAVKMKIYLTEYRKINADKIKEYRVIHAEQNKIYQKAYYRAKKLNALNINT